MGLLRPFAIIATDIGLDFRRMAIVKQLPKYIADCRRFNRLGGGITGFYPMLSDYKETAGVAKGQYFHQDLLVAKYIFESNPVRHIDVGSRIDGFVAHVASFRTIEVMDVRPLPQSGHANILFIQANLIDHAMASDGIADSISCLHAIEHFGLGRYGDPIDPDGHKKGFNSLLKMLKPGGTLYVSMPIGLKSAVCFNAHRVFQVDEVLEWSNTNYKIELSRFDYIDGDGELHRNAPLISNPKMERGCGIYTFRKL